MMFIGAGAISPERPKILYDNALERAVLSGSAAPGFAFENIKGPQTNDFWASILNGQAITATFSAPETINSYFIARHNLAGFQGFLCVRYSPDLVSGFSNLLTLEPADFAANGAGVIGAVFAPMSAMRIQIFSYDAVNLLISKLGACFVGNAVTVPGWIMPPYVPANFADQVEIDASISLGGQYLATTARRKSRAQDVQFSPLARSFMDSELPGFSRHYNAGNPFFFAGSPSLIPQDVAYVWRSGGELRPALKSGGQVCDVKMGLAGYGA